MTIDAIAVVVPVHDEAELLADCLASVEIAARAARGTVARVGVWVVLDACTDESAAIAERFGVTVLTVEHRNVGAARAAGVAAARAEFADVPSARVWTAHTDADSVVPPHWLLLQCAYADDGAEVLIGTVRPDFRDLSAAQVTAWQATHTPGVANGHVHGANLGVRADVLHAAGGFPPIAEHEDVQLVEALRAQGARIEASDAAWVRTSGRQRGRTAGGYARYLREDLLRDAASVAVW